MANGRQLPVNRVPAYATPPMHTDHRCYHEAVLDGWTVPTVVWTGA